MDRRMTPAEWNEIFPKLPERYTQAQARRDSGELSKKTEVLCAIFLPERWSGVDEPPEDQAIVSRFGRWCVTEGGIDCLGTAYDIASDTLNEEDWLAQLLQKSWLYDPSDMLDAFESAREYFFAGESVEYRQEAQKRQMQVAIERGFPFNTSTLLGSHVYLATRMRGDTRRAFCEFLVNQGFDLEF